MTGTEPGGPLNNEYENGLQTLVREFKAGWQSGDSDIVRQSLTAISNLLDSYMKQGTTTLKCRAENRYVTTQEKYNPSYYYLEHAQCVDEPLHPDGKGPLIFGTVAELTSHEIPGTHEVFGGYTQRSGGIPGVMLTNVKDESLESVDNGFTYVPLTYLSECELLLTESSVEPIPQ